METCHDTAKSFQFYTTLTSVNLTALNQDLWTLVQGPSYNQATRGRESKMDARETSLARLKCIQSQYFEEQVELHAEEGT